MDEGIADKVILIIGGGGGIGSEAARALATKGAKIALADIDRKKLDAAIGSLGSAFACAYVVDATKKDDVSSLVDRVVHEFGRLDVIINSAGIMLIRPMAEVITAEWETTIDLNVKATLWGIAAVLPVFIKQQSGHVINLGSVHGLKVFAPGGVVHSASKFAVRAITEGLRTELTGTPIRVTSITPGAVDTGMQKKTTGTDSSRMSEIYKHAIPPSAVARAICFAIEQPQNIAVNEIVVRPTAQAL